MANIKVNNSGNIKTYNDIDTIKVPTDVENEYAVFNLKNTNLTPTFEFNIVDEDEFGVGTVPSVTIKNHNYLNGGKELNEILRSLASYKETINSIYSEEEDNQNKKLWEEICKFSSLAKDFLSPENFHSCNEIIKMAIRNKIRCPKYTLHIRIPAEVASEVALKYYPYLDIS
jgi:hypothetical protein